MGRLARRLGAVGRGVRQPRDRPGRPTLVVLGVILAVVLVVMLGELSYGVPTRGDEAIGWLDRGLWALSRPTAFALALLALQVLDAAGSLTLFGVSLQSIPSLAVGLGIITESVCVTLLGATVTTLALLRVFPASPLSGGESFQPTGTDRVHADE